MLETYNNIGSEYTPVVSTEVINKNKYRNVKGEKGELGLPI